MRRCGCGRTAVGFHLRSMPRAHATSQMQEPPDDTSVLDAEAERAIPFGVPGATQFRIRETSERLARRSADARLGRRASGSPTDSQTRPLARALRGIAPRHLLGQSGSLVSPLCRCGTACRMAVVCCKRIEIGDLSEPSGGAARRQLESHDRSTRGMTCQTEPRCAGTSRKGSSRGRREPRRRWSVSSIVRDGADRVVSALVAVDSGAR
jgi:hypothetical protein